MDKLDFMMFVKDILEETDSKDLESRGQEMKDTIDELVKQEINFDNLKLR